MVAWRMDGGVVELLKEWVVNVDKELREREAANGEEGGKERGRRVRWVHWMVWRPPCANGCMSSNRSITRLPCSRSNPLPLPCSVYPIAFSINPQPRTSITPTPTPSTQTDLRPRNRLLHHPDQTSSLFWRSPSTTVNDHPDSRIGNGGATAEWFVFDPEIAGFIHAIGQEPVIPQVMDHSSVFDLMDSVSWVVCVRSVVVLLAGFVCEWMAIKK
jgi:hypothetical protein